MWSFSPERRVSAQALLGLSSILFSAGPPRKLKQQRRFRRFRKPLKGPRPQGMGVIWDLDALNMGSAFGLVVFPPSEDLKMQPTKTNAVPYVLAFSEGGSAGFVAGLADTRA